MAYLPRRHIFPWRGSIVIDLKAMFYSIVTIQITATTITGRNVKQLSPKMFTSYCFSTNISVSLYERGWQLSLHFILH